MNTDKTREKINEIKKAISQGAHVEAFAGLRALASPDEDFALQSRYARLFGMIPRESLDLADSRVALVASSTVDHFADVLGFWLAVNGMAATMYLSEYGAVQQTVLNPGSDLYAFKPNIVWLFTGYRDVRHRAPAGASSGEVHKAVEAAVQDFAALWSALQKHSPAYIIQNNADLPAATVFGNYEGVAPWTPLNLLRRFNLALAETLPPGVTIFDLDDVASRYGRERWHEPRFWYHSKHAFDLNACGLVAARGARLIGAIKGRAKKCVVLDLDGTLWGGVVGDDGVDGIRLGSDPDGEAFVDFQEYLAALKGRGVILAVASKNEDSAAREPFERHPDMRLKLEDFAVFRANWNNKADNVREIAATLNIGLDSIVFIDDNPAERELVRSLLPEVTVVEMPDDPALFVPTLAREGLFETVVFSDEDKVRSDLYRQNASRAEFQRSFSDLSAYLESLEMEATAGPLDSFHLPRAAQLINKSNQFHLTTTRYTESEIEAVLADPKRHCHYFKLKDRYGDNGLISVVILDEREGGVLFVDTWVMSCRVLSRGVEEFIRDEMATLGREWGCRTILGKYIPTKKNRLVAGLYERLGFRPAGEQDGATLWELDVAAPLPSGKTHIRRVAQDGAQEN